MIQMAFMASGCIPDHARRPTDIPPCEIVLAARRPDRILPRQMNRSGKLHALLATSRVANIPSVASNVWVGMAVGMSITLSGNPDAPGASTLITLPLAGILLYVGGNFFNDWMDREWDARHRPERALPRGLFPAALYLAVSIIACLAGVALAAATSPRAGIAAVGIALSIVIYTYLHKRTPWAVIPMGICRALLPVMGCLAFFPYIDPVWPVACGLLTYIMGLSLSARYESMAEPPSWVAPAGRGLLLGTALLVAWGNRDIPLGRLLNVASVLPYLAWTSLTLRIWNKPVPLLVSRLLAGIPLVDWMLLLPLGLMNLLGNGGVLDFFTAACLLVPPLAFVCALLLQKVAPAT
jgi:hypothetical protein